MYVVLSPAKKLNEGPCLDHVGHTQFDLSSEVQELMGVTKPLKPQQLRELMGISESLAELNVKRFGSMQWPMNTDNARQAALMFAGDTYTGLDASSLGAEDLEWAQRHVGILSGLYGLLRPLDLIQPYRLEMGTKLSNGRGKNLYAFWGDRLAALIDERLAGHDEPVVVNCASNEYFKAAGTKALKAKEITPVFLEQKGEVAKTISFLAKRARGAMARYVITNRITAPEQLRGFDLLDYRYDAERSTTISPRLWRYELPNLGRGDRAPPAIRRAPVFDQVHRVHRVCELQRFGGVEVGDPAGLDVHRFAVVERAEQPPREQVFHHHDVRLEDAQAEVVVEGGLHDRWAPLGDADEDVAGAHHHGAPKPGGLMAADHDALKV